MHTPTLSLQSLSQPPKPQRRTNIKFEEFKFYYTQANSPELALVFQIVELFGIWDPVSLDER